MATSPRSISIQVHSQTDLVYSHVWMFKDCFLHENVHKGLVQIQYIHTYVITYSKNQGHYKQTLYAVHTFSDFHPYRHSVKLLWLAL